MKLQMCRLLIKQTHIPFLISKFSFGIFPRKSYVKVFQSELEIKTRQVTEIVICVGIHPRSLSLLNKKVNYIIVVSHCVICSDGKLLQKQLRQFIVLWTLL